MFTEGLVTVARRWKQPKCPLMEEWISKMWYIQTMGYSALEGKEILTHDTSWMNLENMLSEISPSQKYQYCMIPLI